MTKDEVTHKLRNDRAPGYYQKPPELLKYVPTELYDLIAESLNNIFAKHEYINVGHGLLTALQKPGKPRGPTKSLRPVILLIMLRKVISNFMFLTRIQRAFEEYLSDSQRAYRHGRSTSDIVWCHRFLAARLQKFQEEIVITGIDITSAFDIIERTSLIEILQSFLREDEIRIIRIILSNTTLDIKLSSNISNPLDTNVGSPQRDGLTGCLFIIYLEKALRTLRDRVDNNHVTGKHSCAVSSKSTLPDECIYADDTDLINDCADKKKGQLQLVTPTYSLQVSGTKTEHTVLKEVIRKMKNGATRKNLVH